MLDQSILVIKGKDNEVRAFHNVCQHRGTRLVDERRGTINRMIVCPYHAWSYELDGSLRSAPNSESILGFDPGAVSIPRVQVEEVSAFLFINLDLNATPMRDDVKGSHEVISRQFPDHEELELVGEGEFVVKANWKLVVENATEGYHFRLSGSAHKTFASLIQYEKYEMVPRGMWWHVGGPGKPNVTQAYGHKIGKSKYQTDWFFSVFFWPHTSLYAHPFADFVGSFNQFPLSAEETLLRLAFYRPKRRLNRVTEAAMRWQSEELGPEDISLNELQQRGLRSLGCNSGRLFVDKERSNVSEHILHHFQSLVGDALNTYQASLSK